MQGKLLNNNQPDIKETLQIIRLALNSMQAKAKKQDELLNAAMQILNGLALEILSLRGVDTLDVKLRHIAADITENSPTDVTLSLRLTTPEQVAEKAQEVMADELEKRTRRDN